MPPRPRPPHRLALYRAAVQHPHAEVRFALRAYRHHGGGSRHPHRLREDFAGGAAVAAAWVELDESHRALAVENHGPTARWAQRAADRELGDRGRDLHIVEADVLDVAAPKVDITVALNFSTFIYHDRAALRQYLRHARRGLARDGVLIVDAFGGPGAMRPGVQRRRARMDVAAGDPARSFIYEWQQHRFEPATRRIDCRIHFELPGEDGRGGASTRIENAFRYRWRLWTLPELREVMLEAGFRTAQVWCDRLDRDGVSDGRYRPTTSLGAREDWVAYVVGVR